jgi:hypothetical protein
LAIIFKMLTVWINRISFLSSKYKNVPILLQEMSNTYSLTTKGTTCTPSGAYNIFYPL